MSRILLIRFYEPLRSKFKVLTGRSLIKLDGCVVKMYNDTIEFQYEYDVLSEIAHFNPTTFKVPRVFRLIKTRSRNALIMERVVGHNLDSYLWNFWLYNDPEAVRVFYRLGRAIRELHNLNLSGLRNSNLPSSCPELKHVITELTKKLAALKIVDNNLSSAISDVLKKADAVNEIFLYVNLHGELYFTHILVQDDRIVLLDFHNAQRGPSYFDLAMLSISLYVSLVFPFQTQKRFTLLIEAFLKGYYGKDLNAEIIKSIKLTELYVALREISVYARTLHAKVSPITSLLTTLKIKRLKAAIKEVILPKLTL